MIPYLVTSTVEVMSLSVSDRARVRSGFTFDEGVCHMHLGRCSLLPCSTKEAQTGLRD